MILLTYPNPNKPFDLYPDASQKYAMGVVLAQDGKIVSTFSRKFNEVQQKYTVTGQELLAAVEACKHFEQIIQGCKIRIHSDHKNLTCDGTIHVNLREQRARIFLDSEYALTFVHIAGNDNTAADGLSRLEMADDEPTEITENIFVMLDNELDRGENTDLPLDMTRIMNAQRNDREIQRRISSGKLASRIATIKIDGGDVLTIDGKVWVPKAMQERIIEWYHCNLQHTGINRTVNLISQVFDWKGLRPMVEKYVNSCDSCQRNKMTTKKSYGKILLVPALRNKDPWEVVHIDCCGPWKVKWRDSETNEKKEIEIHLLSIVDACTGWSEFVQIDTASSNATAAGLYKNWLCRYPWPHKAVHDNGPEFMGCEFQEMLESYGITSKPTTVKNPTANAVVERIHGTLGEQLRSTVFESD